MIAYDALSGSALRKAMEAATLVSGTHELASGEEDPGYTEN